MNNILKSFLITIGIGVGLILIVLLIYLTLIYPLIGLIILGIIGFLITGAFMYDTLKYSPNDFKDDEYE